MNKRILTMAMLAISLATMAQETYESAKVTDQDLNGTARYVGMGGALDALGADISVIGSNPAGIGMFRSSAFSFSGGMMISGNDADGSFFDRSKTTGGFDQLGIVFSMPSGDGFTNFAFNYHKSKNFNQVFSADDNLKFASQNKLAWMEDGVKGFTQIDKLYGKVFEDYYYHANGYNKLDASSGYIGNYDFNISGNISDQLYLGFTLGVKDVHYRNSASYVEDMVDGGYVEVVDERKVSGIGYDFNFGAIVRPLASSPFRVGLSISSPTFYRLTTGNDTYLYNMSNFGKKAADNGYTAYSYYEYDFGVNTPWRFGASLGHTFGRALALGAVYEYSDYSFLSNRIIDDRDYYYDEDDSTIPDRKMNAHTKETLKGVHTFKLGAEFKPTPFVSIRAGYNYVTPKYNKASGKQGTIDSWGSECASQTDYVNWQETNRITLGLGFQLTKAWSLDLAYQYSNTNGEYHPFSDASYGISAEEAPYHEDVHEDAQGYFITNYANPLKVSDKRHQLLLSLTYRF